MILKKILQQNLSYESKDPSFKKLLKIKIVSHQTQISSY